VLAGKSGQLARNGRSVRNPATTETYAGGYSARVCGLSLRRASHPYGLGIWLNGAKFALLRTPYNRWAILGSNSPLGLGLGQIARFYLDSVPSDQLGFAQIATKIATKPAPFAALVTIARTPPVRPKQQRHQRRRWLPLAKGKQAPRPCNWRRAGRVGVGGAGVCAERHAAHWLSLEKTSSRPLTSSA
jgi:hypothetical protein